MKKPLTKLQEETLQSFFAQPIGESYFLTGGTALSGFYFYHRTGKGEELKIDLVKDQKVHFGKIETFGNIRVDSIENIGSNKITAFYLTEKAIYFSGTISRC